MPVSAKRKFDKLTQLNRRILSRSDKIFLPGFAAMLILIWLLSRLLYFHFANDFIDVFFRLAVFMAGFWSFMLLSPAAAIMEKHLFKPLSEVKIVAMKESLDGEAGYCRCPPHPGALLAEIMWAEGCRVYEFARTLQTSESHLKNIIQEIEPVTADIAASLAKIYSNSAGFWPDMQSDYDKWKQEQINKSIRRHALAERLGVEQRLYKSDTD